MVKFKILSISCLLSIYGQNCLEHLSWFIPCFSLSLASISLSVSHFGLICVLSLIEFSNALPFHIWCLGPVGIWQKQGLRQNFHLISDSAPSPNCCWCHLVTWGTWTWTQEANSLPYCHTLREVKGDYVEHTLRGSFSPASNKPAHGRWECVGNTVLCLRLDNNQWSAQWS